MPSVKPKLHVVVYAKHAGEKKTLADIVMHGIVDAGSAGVIKRPDDANTFLSATATTRGNVALSVAADDASKTITLKPGVGTFKSGDVTLRAEVREVVEGNGKATSTKLPLSALRVFETSLKRAAARTEIHDTMRAAVNSVREGVVEQQTRVAQVHSEVSGRLHGGAIGQVITDAANGLELELDAILAEVRAAFGEQTARAELAGRGLASFQAAARRNSDALVDIGSRVESLVEAVSELENYTDALRYAAAAVTATARDREPRRRAVGSQIKAALDALTVDAKKTLAEGSCWLDDSQVDRMSALVELLDSPALQVKGTFTVTAVAGKGGPASWIVAAENTGRQPFNATIVFADADKNDGIGFESMALPEAHASAEQHIIFGANYGVKARPGETLRLGVRSLGWAEVKLPKSGSLSVDIADFTLETNGDNRPEDFNQYLAQKRREKFDTGKVRFFVRGKSWTP